MYFVLNQVSCQFTGGIIIEITHAQINPGDKILISGPSGCGKSTMLGLLSLSLRPDWGKEFYCNKRNILELWERNQLDQLASLRASLFGFIPQTSGLIPFLTIEDNIRLPQQILGKHDLSWMQTLTHRLEISSILYRKPHEVSVGQRQRVAVARALINRPSIVLADEPTASVHPCLADEILHLLIETVKETEAALVMTSHDRQRAVQYGLVEAKCQLDQHNQITRLQCHV